mmetsp:Transcript_36896/g.86482  ORF Transcript_36896/g.86482 Transcript_36896/m.86482 type:complete len:247 (-) Transcript_36896:675-1415(-)
MTQPAEILPLSMTSATGILAVTVESTMMVRTKSPTSAVSPPVRERLTPCLVSSSTSSWVPVMTALITSPGIKFLFRPIVLDSRMLSVAPTHKRSSRFMTIASCAMPFQTLRSPVFFQYMYAKEDFVPAPSACMTIAWLGSLDKTSGTILQKALGNKPLSMFLMAAWTSPLSAETPRCSYLFASPSTFLESSWVALDKSSNEEPTFGKGMDTPSSGNMSHALSAPSISNWPCPSLMETSSPMTIGSS